MLCTFIGTWKENASIILVWVKPGVSEVVEVEAFRLAFLVVGTGELAGTFGTGRLFLFQLALGLLLRFFRTLFLSCPFLLPLGGGCTTSHEMIPSKQKICRPLICRAGAQLPHASRSFFLVD